jgi:xylan 1,4-beta-xylosidase
VFQWVRHCVERYGRAEVASWYFQTWNEPNLPQYYWGGTREEFFRLHDTAIRGVRRALPEARVGGPDIAGAGDDFMSAFLAHVKAAGTPTDFLSFHAKGQPQFIETPGGGHVRMGIATHLKAADHEFAQIAADPMFRTKPIVIGESDPEGCAACQGPANAYRNGTMYSSYTAAVFPRLQALADARGLKLEGVLSWAFEYEDQPIFAGFRQLTSAGIDLPVINVFKLFARMGGRTLPASSDHQRRLAEVMIAGVRNAPDIGVIAARDGEKVTVLVWHYHDDDLPGADADVHLAISGLGSRFGSGANVTRWRVDRTHANSYAAWLAMGSPQAPTTEQRARLIEASHLVAETERAGVKAGQATLHLTVPRSGVALIELTPGVATQKALPKR